MARREKFSTNLPNDALTVTLPKAAKPKPPRIQSGRPLPDMRIERPSMAAIGAAAPAQAAPDNLSGKGVSVGLRGSTP